MKIAFIGPSAVGKDSVSDYISKKFNLKHISSSDYIRKYTIKNNLGSLERSDLGKVANNMRDKYGGDILIKMAIEETPDNLILSGLRTVNEIIAFKDLGGIVIAINAPLELRYRLAKSRKRIDDNLSFEDFKLIEEKEYINTDNNKQNISKTVEMADYEIINDGTLDELLLKSENIVRSLN